MTAEAMRFSHEKRESTAVQLLALALIAMTLICVGIVAKQQVLHPGARIILAHAAVSDLNWIWREAAERSR